MYHWSLATRSPAAATSALVVVAERRGQFPVGVGLGEQLPGLPLEHLDGATLDGAAGEPDAISRGLIG